MEVSYPRSYVMRESTLVLGAWAISVPGLMLSGHVWVMVVSGCIAAVGLAYAVRLWTLVRHRYVLEGATLTRQSSGVEAAMSLDSVTQVRLKAYRVSRWRDQWWHELRLKSEQHDWVLTSHMTHFEDVVSMVRLRVAGSPEIADEVTRHNLERG